MRASKKSLEFERILVPLTGTDADDETIKLACTIARCGKSLLYAMYVIRIKRALPIDTEIQSEVKIAEELFERIEKTAKAEGCRLETDLLQAREVGPAIIDEALAKNIDLILMGLKYEKRFGQFSMGGIVPYVLKNATCRVILYSQYGDTIGKCA